VLEVKNRSRDQKNLERSEDKGEWKAPELKGRIFRRFKGNGGEYLFYNLTSYHERRNQAGRSARPLQNLP